MLLLSLLSVVLTAKQVAPVSVQETVTRQLVSPEDVQYSDNTWLHLGIVMADVGPETETGRYYVTRVAPLIASALSFADGIPLHLVFISDEESVGVVADMTEKTLGDVLMKRLLFNSQRWKIGKYSLPKIRVEFTNITVITERYKDKIEKMKENFLIINEKYTVGIEGKESWSFTPAPKFTHDMFYISPFYHLVFPFEKFLVTDADIEFRYNINLLYSEFDKFGEDKLFAFAKDMSPLYRTLLFNYRKAHPGTELGEPGDLQGVNSGVALLHLARMRTSPALAHYLHPGTMDQLCAKFQFQGWLAEQDWWNLVIWDNPDLVHFLDCGFNFQTMEEFNQPPFDQLYPLYHQCASTMRVRHGHNDMETCGHMRTCRRVFM